MKNKLKIITFILVITLIIGITGVVNAYSATGELSSSSKLKEGSIVEVTFKITQIDAGDGIDSIEGKIEYDRNVFEEVTENNLVFQNGWRIGGFSSQTQRFTATRSEKIKDANEMFTLSLKVKDTINVDTTKIKLSEVFVSGGLQTGDIEISSPEIDISKEVVATPTTVPTPTPTPTKTVPTVTPTPTPKTKLPKTGEETPIILLALGIVSVVGVITYTNYKKINIK